MDKLSTQQPFTAYLSVLGPICYLMVIFLIPVGVGIMDNPLPLYVSFIYWDTAHFLEIHFQNC